MFTSLTCTGSCQYILCRMFTPLTPIHCKRCIFLTCTCSLVHSLYRMFIFLTCSGFPSVQNLYFPDLLLFTPLYKMFILLTRAPVVQASVVQSIISLTLVKRSTLNVLQLYNKIHYLLLKKIVSTKNIGELWILMFEILMKR